MLPSSEGLSRPRLHLHIRTLLQRVCISHVVSRKLAFPYSRIFCLQVSPLQHLWGPPPSQVPVWAAFILISLPSQQKVLEWNFHSRTIPEPFVVASQVSTFQRQLPLLSQRTNIRRHENFTDGSFRNCAQRLLNARTVIIRKIFENTGEPNRDEIVFSSISHLTRTAAAT